MFCHIYGRREILLNVIFLVYPKIHLYIVLKNCFNLAETGGYSAYHKVLTSKRFYVLLTECMYVFWMILREKRAAISSLYSIQFLLFITE